MHWALPDGANSRIPYIKVEHFDQLPVNIFCLGQGIQKIQLGRSRGDDNTRPPAIEDGAAHSSRRLFGRSPAKRSCFQRPSESLHHLLFWPSLRATASNSNGEECGSQFGIMTGDVLPREKQFVPSSAAKHLLTRSASCVEGFDESQAATAFRSSAARICIRLKRHEEVLQNGLMSAYVTDDR